MHEKFCALSLHVDVLVENFQAILPTTYAYSFNYVDSSVIVFLQEKTISFYLELVSAELY